MHVVSTNVRALQRMLTIFCTRAVVHASAHARDPHVGCSQSFGTPHENRDMTHAATPPPSDMIVSLVDFAQKLRDSACEALQTEIDLLAGTVMELNALHRHLCDSAAAARLAGICDALDALRAEKVRAVDRMGCLAAADA